MRHTVGAAYVTGALAYGWQDVTTDRTVTVAGVDRLRAEFKANAFGPRRGRLPLRRRRGWASRPMPPGSSPPINLPAYAEQVLSGGNTFALNYAAKDVTALAHRTRPSQRQVVRDAERHLDAARPRRLGA